MLQPPDFQSAAAARLIRDFIVAEAISGEIQGWRDANQ
jgi:hypothetical protein